MLGAVLPSHTVNPVRANRPDQAVPGPFAALVADCTPTQLIDAE